MRSIVDEDAGEVRKKLGFGREEAAAGVSEDIAKTSFLQGLVMHRKSGTNSQCPKLYGTLEIYPP